MAIVFIVLKNKQESLIYLNLERNHIVSLMVTKIENFGPFLSLSHEVFLLPYEYEIFCNIRMKRK